MGDLNSVLGRIVALRQSIVDDGIIHGIPFHVKDIQTMTERSKSEGTSFFKVTLPILGKALDNGLVSGRFQRPMHFSAKRDTCLPTFCGAVFDRIFDADGLIRVLPCVGSIFFLRQFLMLDGKLITEPTILQKKQAIDGFRDRQCALGKTKVPVNHPVLVRAKLLLTRTLKGLDLSNIQPGHGPGGVAEGYDRFERWDFSSWPVRAERWYPFHEYGSQSFMSLCAKGPPVMVTKSITKCALVPKDYKGPRLISAESTATQYLQQGQMRLLMQYIDHQPLLSRSIRMKDQTFNQKMCRESADSGSATLDLSNASDTVSAALVWYLLSGVPRLRSQLFCTRSQFMKIDCELIRITAFSPMGAAVCFPVETLVFWAISMASVRFVQSCWSQSNRKVRSSLPGESETASCIAVFGDDIIVPDYALQTVIGTLTSVGCEINTSKTCYQTPFRESCGSEWFRVSDVTFTRNRRYNYEVTKKVINYPVILDLQRKFFLQGLVCTAALLCKWAREIMPIVTVTVYEYSKEIGSCPTCSQTGSVDQGSGSWNSYVCVHRRSSKFGESHTGFPSGLDKLLRDRLPSDKYVVAIGQHTSLDSGVRTRYNNAYQRVECRLPSVFQRTRQWPSTDTVHKGDGLKAIDLNDGYPRLLARLVGDSVERIAIRDITSKMAWSELPVYWSLDRITG